MLIAGENPVFYPAGEVGALGDDPQDLRDHASHAEAEVPTTHMFDTEHPTPVDDTPFDLPLIIVSDAMDSSPLITPQLADEPMENRPYSPSDMSSIDYASVGGDAEDEDSAAKDPAQDTIPALEAKNERPLEADAMLLDQDGLTNEDEPISDLHKAPAQPNMITCTKSELTVHTELSHSNATADLLAPQPSVPNVPATHDHEADLLPQINGMFRLLDLYSESSSDGLVDKVIIDQDSLREFINHVSPGAYHSVTRIDFASLDLKYIKVTGIYGSKPEIVRFLQSLGAVDDKTATALLYGPRQDGSAESRFDGPSLRSGLYLVFAPREHLDVDAPRETYVVYWPEHTTWDDRASSAVKKNRVAFMRYLTRLCDQVVALISAEHGSKLVWKTPEPEKTLAGFGSVAFSSNRFFEFEVVKTKEQEETATIATGFEVVDRRVASNAPQPLRPGEPNRSFEPILVSSDYRQAFLTRKLHHTKPSTRATQNHYTVVALQSELAKHSNIRVHESVTPEGMQILVNEGGLKHRAKDLCKAWNDELSGIKDLFEKEYLVTVQKIRDDVQASIGRLGLAIRVAVAVKLAADFELLDASQLYSSSEKTEMSFEEASGHLDQLVAVHPTLREALHEGLKEAKLGPAVNNRHYKQLKKRFLITKQILDTSSPEPKKREELIRGILEDVEDVGTRRSFRGTALAFATKLLTVIGVVAPSSAQEIQTAVDKAQHPDAEFLRTLSSVVVDEPLFEDTAAELKCLALSWAQNKTVHLASTLVEKMKSEVTKSCNAQAERDWEIKSAAETRSSYDRFRHVFDQVLTLGTSPPLFIKTVIKTASAFGYTREIMMQAHYEFRLQPSIEYGLHILELPYGDKQRIQEDPRFRPNPKIRHPITFFLPLESEIKHIHLLGANRCLLIAESPAGIAFYLSDLNALARGKPVKQLPPIKGRVVFAIDETKRLLAMVIMAPGALKLQLLAFDEDFSAVRSRGSPLNVTDWYEDGPPVIHLACFIAGSEDLCLLEDSGRIRIYSFISQTFRPAALQLPAPPANFFSTPDGSALVAVEAKSDDGYCTRIFHTTTLGSDSMGIVPQDGPTFKDAHSFTISSLGHRRNAHIISLSPATHTLSSAALFISKKSTDFQYQSKGRLHNPTNRQEAADHNSLLECLADVWTRYPVVPAITREPISSSTRMPRSMTYVASASHERFGPYFKRMIRDFETSTHKPTNGCLDAIEIQSFNFEVFLEMTHSKTFEGSSFRAGEWVVELLCLIPIHIAVARENRFVPLSNGVINPAFEQDLLGAEVSKIVGALTFGWYESILSSYMATKPVKVISSMGEQSVGKSYSLNHIVDSSFAGSAVRTTEGVWLSLCPTPDLLIIALDFEGVHSLERTPQEDMLLVLFNTAISNMVLFRNNFALSRDVANMFTSFQSSTSVLDPASNPQLFKGLLVVIIKDVVEADKDEIVKEFSSKFTQIVTEEQGTNFISVLHAGQNLVVPWPVIQSQDFYTLFEGLSMKLSHQDPTHRSAGEFLITLKTLMAKLKAQDWSALDQNLVKYRVKILASLLPTAIALGLAEVHPEHEPLKNLENQLPVPTHGDTDVPFCTLKPTTVESQFTLKRLITQWAPDAARHNIYHLEEHLLGMVQARIFHVRDWLAANLERFSAEDSDVRALYREFDDACEKLRSSVQICRGVCDSCRLPCLLNKIHPGSKHNCGTSHNCLDSCEFMHADENYAEEIPCCLSAGHTGRHICEPAAHYCGQACALKDKKGCQLTCTKSVNHLDDGHTCSARLHRCGQPCSLKDLQCRSAPGYSCPNCCVVSHDEPHGRHSCGDSLSCPIQCELCPRLCALGDHFHGLETDAVHLCGQEHACKEECMAPGTCQIHTAPRSVETTFMGAYETFQYTKYTQEARRLGCAVPIPPRERVHEGEHNHSTAKGSFHYCETSCPRCGYICTLPLGHVQAEHETAHGSMEHTAWAVEDTADATIEIQGRKYASQDAGAPHMCNLVCAHQGRHAHIDYCRARDPRDCQEEQSLHIGVQMAPEPKRPKDWVTHALFWKRSGFKDPYSKEEQADFARCDTQCAGPEHKATPSPAARPSFCTLPLFHPPQPLDWLNPDGHGYVSNDGHAFTCVNPNTLRQAFHVIFVLDKSGSMSSGDRKPLANTPTSALIARKNNNRFGAVLSALDAFWSSRNAGAAVLAGRRDAYSVVVFDTNARVTLENDFLSTPQQLLNGLIDAVKPGGGTNFNAALDQSRLVMERCWSTERSPVVIFLSDGQCQVNETKVHDLCNRAIALGKPLSLHAVSFGREGYTPSFKSMVRVGNEACRNVTGSSGGPAVQSTFTNAIDTIRLAETFINIAESLKKPRGSLIRA